MSTKDIRVLTQDLACEVCGRNLLRGEHAERYLARGEWRWVCDLCVSRALRDGWVREGTLPPYEPGEHERERRTPLLPRLRARLGGRLSDGEQTEPQHNCDAGYPVHRPGRSWAPLRAPQTVRESRHVRAVPTSPEQKVSSGIRAFNGSEHTRTIAGVARALGPPDVTIRPSEMEASAVTIVAAWELCWYRYEIDLADELPSVRVAARGSELDELGPTERKCNVSADADGALALRT